jgi:hypothetical protein
MSIQTIVLKRHSLEEKSSYIRIENDSSSSYLQAIIWDNGLFIVQRFHNTATLLYLNLGMTYRTIPFLFNSISYRIIQMPSNALIAKG